VLSTAPSALFTNTRLQQAGHEQEVQELKAKIRALEGRRESDAREIESLRTQIADANSFVQVKPKLLAKLSSLQQDLTSTQRKLADAEQLSMLNENRMLDAQEQLEMVMLDKEVAEERAEAAESELETLREKFASAEVELESARNGVATGAGVDPSIKNSLAYTQLEKHNERLKDALLK
jgi:dynactin 1